MRFNRHYRSMLFAGAAGISLLLPAMAQAQDSPTDEAGDAAPEIVVTGSLIRQSTVSTPLTVVAGGEISARAVTNPSELVSMIPGNSGSEAGVDQLNQPLTSGTAQFNLRNLGLGSTLVLVNNRRQTLAAVASSDGSTFVDINSLVPLIAIQRIEVVKDGAGATYGSDAVAGVVNFITRKSVDLTGPKFRPGLTSLTVPARLTCRALPASRPAAAISCWRRPITRARGLAPTNGRSRRQRPSGVLPGTRCRASACRAPTSCRTGRPQPIRIALPRRFQTASRTRRPIAAGLTFPAIST